MSVRRARMLCICGLCIYMVFCMPADHACIDSNIQTLCCCWRWMLNFDAGWSFCSKYKQTLSLFLVLCLRCKQVLSKLTQTPKPVFIERVERRRNNIKNHIHLKSKIRVQWIDAVAVHKSEYPITCRQLIQWHMHIDLAFVSLIWLRWWSSRI